MVKTCTECGAAEKDAWIVLGWLRIQAAYCEECNAIQPTAGFLANLLFDVIGQWFWDNDALIADTYATV